VKRERISEIAERCCVDVRESYPIQKAIEYAITKALAEQIEADAALCDKSANLNYLRPELAFVANDCAQAIRAQGKRGD
jgi:hypothetical protein